MPLTLPELNPGDVCLVHSEGDLVDTGIQVCTASMFNHAFIHKGEENGKYVLAQAGGSGFKTATYDEAFAPKDKWVDVYRYIQRQDNRILWMGIDFPLKPIIDSINNKLAENDSYPYDQILDLFLICELRRISGDSAWRGIVEAVVQYGINLLDTVPIVAQIKSLIDSGKNPQVCSASVFQIYKDAGFPLEVLPSSMYVLYQNLARSCEDDVLKAFASAGADQSGINPNFVVPKDLAESPNLMYLGRLAFGNLQTELPPEQ